MNSEDPRHTQSANHCTVAQKQPVQAFNQWAELLATCIDGWWVTATQLLISCGRPYDQVHAFCQAAFDSLTNESALPYLFIRDLLRAGLMTNCVGSSIDLRSFLHVWLHLHQSPERNQTADQTDDRMIWCDGGMITRPDDSWNQHRHSRLS